MADYTPSQAPLWAIKYPGGIPVDFDENTIATHAIVAAPGAGRRVRLLYWHLYIAGAQGLIFKSGTDDIIGADHKFNGEAYWTSGAHEGFRIEADTNAALQVALDAALQVKGFFLYQLVTVRT